MPNIIYVLSDEHRGQAMSHAGDPNVCTPVLDRMAQDGASFERAYSNCPVCTPSRGTIFSGRHAHAGPVAGFFDNCNGKLLLDLIFYPSVYGLIPEGVCSGR